MSLEKLDANELFDIIDSTGKVIGSEKRSIVHQKGYLHRSVNVLVFDRGGAVLTQKRSKRKDVCPNHWDLSCAEHLKCGETFKDAAVRGIQEELGLSTTSTHLHSNHNNKQIAPLFKAMYQLKATYPQRVTIAEKNIDDNEHQQAFALVVDVTDGNTISDQLLLQKEEVVAVAWQSVDDLVAAKNQNVLTPWFLTILDEVIEHMKTLSDIQ